MQYSRRQQQHSEVSQQQFSEFANIGFSNSDMNQALSGYTVQSGDTLWVLAQRFGTSVSALQSSNQLAGDTILAGQSLSIPGGAATGASQGGSHTVRTGDSLWAIAQDNGVSIDALCRANGLNQWSTIHPGDVINIPGGGATQQSSSSAASSQSTNQSSQSTQQNPPSAPPAAPNSSGRQGYNAALGAELARASRAENGGSRYSKSRCYEYVANAVDRVIGRFLTGGHAYMAASQLAARKDLFTETSAGSLSSLPAGAIVVWGKGSSKSGHISIALGDGQESSDFIGPQMPSHYGGAPARVFLPKARM